MRGGYALHVRFALGLPSRLVGCTLGTHLVQDGCVLDVFQRARWRLRWVCLGFLRPHLKPTGTHSLQIEHACCALLWESSLDTCP